MNNITREMLKIYKPLSGLDWMNYRLVKKDVTYHHIVKREHGGDRSIENGALLMPVAHQYLHLIEFKDIERYEEINRIFEIVNRSGCEPSREEREIIEYLLREFESVHKWDKNSKGKLLLQRKYLERDFNRSK